MCAKFRCRSDLDSGPHQQRVIALVRKEEHTHDGESDEVSHGDPKALENEH